MTDEQARFICASLRGYFAALHPSENLIERAIDLALRLRHPIYDCVYFACAERTGAPLITADQRLLVAIDGTELASLAIPLDRFAAA